MKKEDNLSIGEEHEILLEIYKNIDEICKKHNWKPFLTGGSVLGAVRHKGFIPWDDDMDIALSRNEYEEFIKIAPKELPSYMELKLSVRGRHYIIVDTRYEKKLDQITVDVQLGGSGNGYIFIDIQPFDGVPSNRIHRIIHCSKVFFWRIAYKLSDSSKLHKAPWRSKVENIIIATMKWFSFLFSNEELFLSKFDNTAKKYTYEDSDYIADFYGKYRYKDVYPKNWWEPGIIVSFENIKVRIPSGYDNYLRQIYGDYMIIPDEKHRFVHQDNVEK